VILSAVYMLWMFQRVNYGPLTNDKNRGLRDLSVREWFVIAPICAMAIFMGVAPGVFLKPMEPAVRKTLEQIVPNTAPANARAIDPPADRLERPVTSPSDVAVITTTEPQASSR
jgi:NADH-quinone oxidoreductase subunit M